MDLENASSDAGSERILALIKRRGPQRTAALAETLAISPEAARQQIVRLERLGLVRASVEAGGAGRPARAWSLTDRGHARFPDRHADLTVDLIATVRAEFGDGALDRLIERREAVARRAYATGLASASSLAVRVRRLAAMRAAEGYLAEASRIAGGWLLVENHCPICAAATACLGFCRSELDTFRTVLGADVSVERTDHILAGARRCAYVIRMREKETTDGLDGSDARGGSGTGRQAAGTA